MWIDLGSRLTLDDAIALDDLSLVALSQQHAIRANQDALGELKSKLERLERRDK